MSTTIDSKVVEMRFDNKHFESNVSTTMSTLDKLKQKLHLDGATKGLEGVNSAAKKVDMTGLGTAVETVQAKFSAMQVVGVTALANITNSAVNAGKRIVSALTIDPVKTGLSEYETKINAIQVIKANTRSKYATEAEQMEDIEKKLSELNDYADRTIYNYIQMTDNLGKFVNQGLELDEATNAVMGLANLAGASGASAADMARATYQMSQALGSVIRMQDWRSLMTANMAGEELKKVLSDFARVEDIDIDSMIAEKGTFEKTLEEGWLTGDLFTKAMNVYSDAYSEAELKAMGFKDEQIKNFKDLAATAREATTEVKTASQLWDVLKETAQSGWTQTWELIIGDFDTAKKMFTSLQVYFSGIINATSDARNRVLEIALAFSKPWDAIQDKISKITGTVDKVTGAVSGALKPLEYFQDVVDRVWMGEFNNWGDNPDRRDLLKAAGYDHRVVQELVNLGEESWNAGKVYKLSMEEIEAAHKKFGLTMETTTEETKDATTAFEKLSDEQLKNAGLTEDEIKLYRALEQEADKAGISVSELAKEMSETDGRTLLIDSFKNLGDVIVGTAKAIKDAWIEIFDPPSVEELGVRLYGVIRAFNEFTEKLRLTDKETGELNDNGKKVQRTLKGIFAAIDIVLTVVGGPLKIAFKAFTQLLGMFDLNILDVTAAIGDAIVGFRDWIDETLDFTKVFEKVIPPIANAVEAFRNWIDGLKESENLPLDIAKGIASGFGKIVDFVKKVFKKIPEYFSNGFEGLDGSSVMGFVDNFRSGLGVVGEVIGHLGNMIKDKIKEFLSRSEFAGISGDSIAGLIQGFKDGTSNVWESAVEMVSNLVQKVKDFLGIESPSKVFIAIGGFIIAGLIAGLQNGIPDSLGAIKDVIQPILDWLKGIDFGAILAGVIGIGAVSATNKIGDALGAFASPLEGLGDVFTGVGKVLDKSAKPIAKVIKNTAKVINGFKKVLNAEAFKTRMEGVMTFVQALLLLIGAIIVLTYFDPLKLLNAVIIIGILGLVVVGLAYLMSKISSASATIGKDGINISGLSSGLLGLGIAILLIGITVKMIGTLEPEQAQQGLESLHKIIIGIILVIATFGLLCKGDAAKSINDLGKMMTKMAITLLLLVGVIKLVSKLEEGELYKGINFFVVFLGFVFVLSLIALIPSKNVDKLGGMLLKISFALLLMVAVIKLAACLTEDEIKAGIEFLKMFAKFVLAMAVVSLIGGKGLKGLGGMLLSVSFSILLLVGVIKLIGMLTPEELEVGIKTIMIFASIIAGFVVITSLFGSKAPKVAGTIIAFSVAIGILAAVAIVCSLIKTEGLMKGILAVGVLSIMMAIMIAATRGANDVTGSIIAITVAIGVLVAAVALLTLIDPTKLAITTTVMTILMGMLALVIKVAGQADKALWVVLAMAGVIAVIGGILYLLSKIPVESSIGSAIALGGLMLVMTGILALMIPLGKKAAQATKGALALASLAIPLALFGLVLAMMSALNVTNALPNVIALSVLCTAMTLLLIPLSLIGSMAQNALLGVLALAAMAAPLALFGLVLAMMSALNVTNALPNVIALSVLCTALSLALLPLSFIGALAAATGGTTLLGIVALLAMAVPLVAFVGILALMENLQNAEKNTLLLTSLLLTLTGVLVVLAIVGPLALIGVVALTALTGLMVAFGALAIAIGALMQEFPQLQSFLDTGIPVLEQLAGGLGSMIGSFIAGFAGEVMTILPQLGLSLSMFMMNAMPFIMGAKLVDESVLSGVGILAGAVLALTAADLIAGVLSFIQGGSSFADLGTELSMFMMNAMPFIMGASMLSEDMMNGVKALAETILILTAADILEGLTSWLTGGSSLAGFSEQLPILGSGIRGFLDSIGTFSEAEVTTINCAANAVKTLASAASEIPNTGGLLGSIVGDNDLGPFADYFPVLGTGLRGFLDNVGTFGETEIATVTAAADAVKTLASAASEVPNTGGLLGDIVGDNDLGPFADYFPKLGSGLRGFLDNVGTFGEDETKTVTAASDAVKSLASAASTVPNTGGWLADIVGDNSLGTFASEFPKVGTGIRGLITNIGESLTTDEQNTVTCAANAVKALAQAAQAVPNTGGWLADIVGDNSLGTFASEFPKVGTGIRSFLTNIGAFTPEETATVTAATDAIRVIAGLANYNLDSFGKNIEGFGSKLPGLGTNLASFASSMNLVSSDLLEKAATYVDKVMGIVNKVKTIDTTAASNFKQALTDLSGSSIKAFADAFTSGTTTTTISTAISKMISTAKTSVESNGGNIKTAFETIVSDAVKAIKTQSNYNKFNSAGSYLVSGFKSGISENTWKATAQAKAMAAAAAEAAKKELEINSPSKVFRRIGSSIPEGLASGIDKFGGYVIDSSNNMSNTAINGVKKSIAGISRAINTDIDAQPTIRPVLDLSDVRSGASMLSSMLDMNSSVGVSANIGAISSMMNARSQNGANDDVVSAIDKLNAKLDKVGGTSYNINGITYDDGSNISSAIETIARAAIKGRRM